jgi:Beta-lactamase enzyme family
MRRFTLGLALGVIMGALGTIGVVVKMAAPVPELIALDLPEEPIADAERLTSYLEERPYEIGYFAKDLRTGKTVERFADRPVCLASIVKLFCLSELYRQKHEEALDLSQKIQVPSHGSISLADAADLMIGQSDNSATQALTEFLGRENVNNIPALLGIDSMSPDILPEEGTFRQTLDKRIFGDRVAKAGLPQHGTAGGIGVYLELLLSKRVVSATISTELIDFLLRHPKPFSTHYAGQYEFAGKGGNLLWTRPPKHYSMMGWGLFVKTQRNDDIVLCVWGEWFPENMPPEAQSEFLKYVTDCVISIVER